MGIDSSLRGYYFTGFVELLDGKNRLVFPAKWRPSFIERYHSIGSDLMRKKDRCFGLHMMQYKDKNPYIAFLDNAWFGQNRKKVLDGSLGVDPVSLEILTFDAQWRMTMPQSFVDEAELHGHGEKPEHYAYLVGNEADKYQTVMVWALHQALKAGILAEGDVNKRRSSKHKKRKSLK